MNMTFLQIQSKENLYRKENPNTYLARFAKFMIIHREDPYMQNMIFEGLRRFIKHQLFQFENAKDVPIHFVGSISYFLQDEVKSILKEFELTLGTLVKRPIDQLVQYHSKPFGKRTFIKTQREAIIEISTRTNFGRLATSTVSRAGAVASLK